MASVKGIGTITVQPIGGISPAPDNPRKITDRAVEMVAASIEKFGWQQPIIVDKKMVIIAGHTRYRAAQLLKLTEVPVIVAKGLTPAQVKAYRIADNRTADYTSWDFTALTEQLDDLAGEFSDVLGLADWDAVMEEFNKTTEAPPSTELQMETATFNYLAGKHQITVLCDSEEAARKAAAKIIDMPGVVDVREKR